MRFETKKEIGFTTEKVALYIQGDRVLKSVMTLKVPNSNLKSQISHLK